MTLVVCLCVCYYLICQSIEHTFNHLILYSLIYFTSYSFREGYGSGNGPRHITRLNCSGGENTILDCYRENTTISRCGPVDIMAIRCSE